VNQILLLNRPSQKKNIHEYIQKDKFAIIILDSCRFDYFQQEISKFIDGDLKPVYTSATATKEYIQTIWDGYYPDITYITALSAPTDHTFERDGDEYLPSEHFERFVHLWKICENKELGAVPPEEMTKAALQQNDDKMIIHYVQPHAPYIGDYRLRQDNSNTTWGKSLQDIYKKIGRYDLDDKTISDRDLKKAYQSNLRSVLSSVHKLVSQLDRPIVITADHGEMLGEGNRYIHGGFPTEELCKLPWYEVDESIIGRSPSNELKQVDQTGSDFTEDDVEEQLKGLGYI
jgi:hypothetical protein